MFLAIASDDPGHLRGRAASGASRPGVVTHLDSPRGAVMARVDDPRAAALILGPRTLCVGRARLDAASSNGHVAIDPLDVSLRRLAATIGEGVDALGLLIGEFGCAVWDGETGTLTAARDPLGLTPLYYRQRGRALEVADSLDAFDDPGAFDPEFIADFIAQGGICTDRTIWASVRPVPAGTVLRWHDGRVELRRHWSPAAFSPTRDLPLDEAAAEFRALTMRAVARDLEPGGGTWAHLSGGLDSSTNVATAVALAREGHTDRRLGGTVTLVDSLGDSDDTRHAAAVVAELGVPNQRVVDDWPWRSDEGPPPATDQPNRDYPFYARDRSIARTLTAAGGRVLLTGVGPDLYLPITSAHIPDLVWRGRLAEAASELHRWTLATRASVWQTAVRDVVVPLVAPRRVRVVGKALRSPIDWLQQEFERRFGMRRRADRDFARHARGDFYRARTATTIAQIAGYVPGWWATTPDVEMRHPLLYRPLVEFTLQLPYRLRSDAYRQKPLLRAAMAGVLPEPVRTRVSKGSFVNPRWCWAFARERRLLAGLLRAPVLGDLRCVEPGPLLAALDGCANGTRQDSGAVYAALSLETWLSVKSGRPLGGALEPVGS